MKKWYWKNGMAFLLAVAMLLGDIVPAAAAGNMGETELPTYEAVSWGDATEDVSISDLDVAITTTGIEWVSDKAMVTVTSGDVKVFTYTAKTGELAYDAEKKGNYVALKFKVPTGVSVTPGDLASGVVTGGDITTEKTVGKFFGKDSVKAGDTKEVSLALTADKKKAEITIDWDGSGKKYNATKYVLDFSNLTLKEAPKKTTTDETSGDTSGGDQKPVEKPVEKPAPKYPNGRIETVARGEVPNVTAYVDAAATTTLRYVSEIPQIWLTGSDNKTKGYNKVAVKISAPDDDEYLKDLSKTTVDGAAWNTLDRSGDSFYMIKDLEKVFAEDAKAADKKVEIKVNWAGKKAVTYVLDFTKATKGEDPEYAMPESMKIVGYSKNMVFGSVQQLDVSITKTFPTDIVKVKFVATSNGSKVDEKLLEEGIVLPLDKSGKVKIKAIAIKRDGTPLTKDEAGGDKFGVKKVVESKEIKITLKDVAAPKTVKIKDANDNSALLTWGADTASANNPYASVEYKISGLYNTTKYKATNASDITTTSNTSAYKLNETDLKKINGAVVEPGKKFMIGLVKVVTVKDANGKVLKTLESKAASAKLTLTKMQPIGIEFKDAPSKPVMFEAGVFKSVATLTYPKTTGAKASSKIVYASKDKNVATISNKGQVTPKGLGTTIISATVAVPGRASLYAEYELTVTTDKTITVTPKKSKGYTMAVGESVMVKDLYTFKIGRKAVNLSAVEVKFDKLYDTMNFNFKVYSVSGNNAAQVTSGDVSGGEAKITARKETAAKSFAVSTVTVNGKKIENVKAVKIKVNQLAKPGTPKLVKAGTTGDNLKVSFAKSKYADYYIVQLYDSKGKKPATKQIILNNSDDEKYGDNNFDYTFRNVAPKTKYKVKVIAGYSDDAEEKDPVSKPVWSKALNAGKLAVKNIKNIAYYNRNEMYFAAKTYVDVSGNEIVSSGDVSGCNAKYGEWNVEVPYGEELPVAALVDDYVRATSSDVLTWNISKADKKLVTVKASKNSYDAVLTGKKTTMNSTVTITIKSKNTGNVVGTLKVKVVPNAGYGKTVISNLVKAATAK